MVWPINEKSSLCAPPIVGGQAEVRQRIGGKANFQPAIQPTRRKRQQIRAQPKDKNAS